MRRSTERAAFALLVLGCIALLGSGVAWLREQTRDTFETQNYSLTLLLLAIGACTILVAALILGECLAYMRVTTRERAEIREAARRVNP